MLTSLLEAEGIRHAEFDHLREIIQEQTSIITMLRTQLDFERRFLEDRAARPGAGNVPGPRATVGAETAARLVLAAAATQILA